MCNRRCSSHYLIMVVVQAGENYLVVTLSNITIAISNTLDGRYVLATIRTTFSRQIDSPHDVTFIKQVGRDAHHTYLNSCLIQGVAHDVLCLLQKCFIPKRLTWKSWHRASERPYCKLIRWAEATFAPVQAAHPRRSACARPQIPNGRTRKFLRLVP